jgi:hypothetical protein
MEVGSIVRQVCAIVLVFGLLGVTFWKLRRGGSPTAFLARWASNSPLRKTVRRGRAFELVERCALTPQHALHLIRIQGREIVIATHPQGCTVLENAASGLGDAATGAGA